VEQGSRLDQVVQAAGGATEDADLAAVNLAARVGDEDHWHVPRQGEEAQPQQASSSATSQKIDLNQADPELLKSLPGIGDVKAQAIISYRQANGPFPNVDALLGVPGIGAATLDGIRDLVEVR
jgi:competence protein ComEA